MRALALAPALARCAVAEDEKRSLYWEEIDVQVTVNPDSTLSVCERQHYVFDGAWNGGYRDLDLQRVERYSDFEVWRGNLKYHQGIVSTRGGFIIERQPRAQVCIRWRSRDVDAPQP